MTKKQSHLHSFGRHVAGLSALLLFLAAGAYAQETQDKSGPSASELLNTPVTSQRIGGLEPQEPPKPPINLQDPEVIARGMAYFDQMNCAGCHAPNGGGGMGPALSNAQYIYGDDPRNVFLSIAQGRPRGMPAWSEMLPEDAIWDLVAYMLAISKKPKQWGQTISPRGFEIEQVPAQVLSTPEPWAHTRPFSFGRPSDKEKGDGARSSGPGNAPPAAAGKREK